MDYFYALKNYLNLLLLQSAWSYQGKQTIGFLFALTKLKNNSETKKKIVSDSAFNTNPYCTGLLLGLMQHYDNIANEWFIALQHTFGSLGDEFFWRLLRPMLMTISVIILLYGYLFSPTINLGIIYAFVPFIYLIFFSFVSQQVRFKWFVKAVKSGRTASLTLANFLRKPLSKLYNLFAFLAGLCLSAVILLFLYGFNHQIAGTRHLLLLIGFIILFIILIGFLLKTERASSLFLIGGLLIFLVIKLL